MQSNSLNGVIKKLPKTVLETKYLAENELMYLKLQSFLIIYLIQNFINISAKEGISRQGILTFEDYGVKQV